MAISLKLNGETHTVEAEPGTPLLWVIRDELKLTGTKFGCGVASCGACTVHMDGEPVRSCQTYIEDVEGAEITTIEKMEEDKVGAAVQQQSIATRRTPRTHDDGGPVNARGAAGPPELARHGDRCLQKSVYDPTYI